MRTLRSALGVASWALLLGQFAFADEPIYKVGGDVTAPRPIHTVEAAYTEEARQAGIEGAVVLYLEISAEGRPENIHVRTSLRPDLDKNAIAAIEQWIFEPAKKDGKPVRTAETMAVSFRLPQSPADDNVYKVGGDVSAPQAIKHVEPKYTAETRAAGVEGTVRLKVVINREGRPEDIVVVKSLHPDLDANAIAAVQQWEFDPGRKGGTPVRVPATIEINFRLGP
ncbi:MAG: energy transducer TonB [Bryobacteraceae bacterium]